MKIKIKEEEQTPFFYYVGDFFENSECVCISDIYLLCIK